MVSVRVAILNAWFMFYPRHPPVRCTNQDTFNNWLTPALIFLFCFYRKILPLQGQVWVVSRVVFDIVTPGGL